MSSTRLSILMKVGVFHMRELQQVSTKQFFLIQHLKWNIGYNTDTLMQNVNVLFDWWAALTTRSFIKWRRKMPWMPLMLWRNSTQSQWHLPRHYSMMMHVFFSVENLYKWFFFGSINERGKANYWTCVATSQLALFQSIFV